MHYQNQELMWRNIGILAVVVGAISLAACKSDWRCSCDLGGITVDTVYQSVTKKEARANCDKLQQDINTLFPNVTCDISKAK